MAARALERGAFRDVYVGQGLGGARAALQAVGNESKRGPLALTKHEHAAALDLVRDLEDAFAPLLALSEGGSPHEASTLAKAHAAVRAGNFRVTERRRAASRANIQKAIAWRRSPEGNAVARRNAFRHGLAVKKLPELLKPLAETPEDFARHYALVERVFQPPSEVERDLVFSLARASWRRIRILRARARLEVAVWRRRLARKSPVERLSLKETARRAEVISRRMERASNVEDESLALATRIERLLANLIRARQSADGEESQASATTENT